MADASTLRPYRDGDAETLAALYNQSLRHASQIRLDAEVVRRRWFEHPGFRPTESSWIAESAGGTPLAAAHVLFHHPDEDLPVPEVHFRFWLLGSAEILQQQAGLPHRLISLCVTAARREPRQAGFGYRVGTGVMRGDTWKEDLVEAAGLRPVRSFFTMRRRQLELLEPTPSLAGIQIRPWNPGLDRALWRALDEAFRDHWGYQETTYEDFQRMAHGPDTRPDLWRLAVEERTGEIAGVNVTGFSRETDSPRQEGWVHDLGVRRPWRGRGVGYALLLAGMHALRDDNGLDSILLGVDAENPTGALRLYRKAGFEIDYEERAWEASLDP